MKKTTLILLAISIFTGVINAQSTIFSETFGITKATRDGCTSVTVPGTAEPGKYDDPVSGTVPLKNQTGPKGETTHGRSPEKDAAGCRSPRGGQDCR